jgi:hypothetical protein
MNQRIRLLAEQAGIHDDVCSMCPIHELEKFAELMVEEACQAFWSEACHVSDLAYEDYHRNSKKIRQHFGVEE